MSEITPVLSDGVTKDINNPTLFLNWSEQAENYWILQDNQGLPIIFNGSIAVRSNQKKLQVPVGNVMCYAQGRLSVALPNRTSFRVGDLVFGTSGTQVNSYRDAILYFTENNFYNEGGDFNVRIFGAPTASGPIRSMKSWSVTDSALGQGPMMVGTPYACFTVQLPFDRTTWKNLQQPIQTVDPILGPLAQDSTVIVNSDMWYRAIDGIRSYKAAQKQFNGSLGNTPMSAEIDETLSYDAQNLLENGSGVLFDNRILLTVSPVQSQYGIWHRGLAVIDLNLISGLRGKTAPCWEGIWSGLRILKIVKGWVNGIERCFIYNLNDSNEIDLWEMIPTQKFDDNGSGPTINIPWGLESRSYTCGSNDDFKRLETGRLIFSNLVGSLTGTVEYKTDESACWNPWQSINPCAKNKDCGPYVCGGPITYREQVRTPVKLQMPPDTFDTIAGRKNRTGYEFAVRLSLSGYANLRALRIYALPEPESLSPERNQT